MQIQELFNYTKLFDTYGKLLSTKQYEVMDKLLNLDLGESEMAELENGSRQSIHDAITKAKKQLVEFEEKCHIVELHEKLQVELEQLKQTSNNESKKKIENIINNL